MKYMILTRAGFAVAVPSDWKTAGAFKRLQRIVNFKVKPSDRIAVDGQIGPKTAKTVLGLLRNQNMDVLPAWDMTPTDQVKSSAENVEDLSAAIALEIDAATGEPRPYIHVRNGLEARILRPVYYQLVELGEFRDLDGEESFGIWSGGRFFILGSTDGLR